MLTLGLAVMIDPEVPELVNMHDATLRRQCLRAARRRVSNELPFGHREGFAALFLAVVIPLSYIETIGKMSVWFRIMWMVVLAVAFSRGFWWVERDRLRRHVRELIGQMANRCVGCAYDLTGCRSERCPECGERREPQAKSE